MASPESVVKGLTGEIRVGGMEYIFWLTSIGKGRTVGWKWRKAGRVHCENIDGKLFITQEEIDRFWSRVKAGEFAKPVTPAVRNRKRGGRKLK